MRSFKWRTFLLCFPPFDKLNATLQSMVNPSKAAFKIVADQNSSLHGALLATKTHNFRDDSDKTLFLNMVNEYITSIKI